VESRVAVAAFFLLATSYQLELRLLTKQRKEVRVVHDEGLARIERCSEFSIDGRVGEKCRVERMLD
jgi:hypothetical protein